MVNIIVEVSKYLMIILMTVYTYLCFSIFGFSDPDRKKRLLRKQNVLMFAIHLVAFMVMYLKILSDAGGTVWGYYPSVYEHLSQSVQTGGQQYVHAAVRRHDHADPAGL